MVRIPAGNPDTPGAVAGPEAPGAGGRRRTRNPSAAGPGLQEGGSPRTVRRRVSPAEMVTEGGETPELPPEMVKLFQQMSESYPNNYRSKILPGNIGLLEIDILFPPHDRLGAAMRELADTDALILDIRSCRGGTGFTTLPLESVFFPKDALLTTMAERGMEPRLNKATEDTPGGVKYLGKPVYILTSNGTGSAC